MSEADATQRRHLSGSTLLDDPSGQLGLTSDAPVEARAATDKAAGSGKIGEDKAKASKRPYPRLQQHGLGSVSDEALEGEADIDADIGPASSRTTEAGIRKGAVDLAPLGQMAKLCLTLNANPNPNRLGGNPQNEALVRGLYALLVSIVLSKLDAILGIPERVCFVP